MPKLWRARRSEFRPFGLNVLREIYSKSLRKLTVGCEQDIDFERISYGNYELEWTLDSVWKTVLMFVNQGERIYFGITEDPLWRLKRCQGHNGGTMEAHYNHFRVMHVICADSGLVIAGAGAAIRSRIMSDDFLRSMTLNARQYRRDPVAHCMFLCLCVGQLSQQ